MEGRKQVGESSSSSSFTSDLFGTKEPSPSSSLNGIFSSIFPPSSKVVCSVRGSLLVLLVYFLFSSVIGVLHYGFVPNLMHKLSSFSSVSFTSFLSCQQSFQVLI